MSKKYEKIERKRVKGFSYEEEGRQKLVKFLLEKAKEYCERLKLSLFKKKRPKVYYFLKFQITLPCTTERGESKENKGLCQNRHKLLMPILEGLKTKVKYFLADAYYSKIKKIYRKVKCKVEQVIGIVKNKFGNKDNVINFHVACLYVLARFTLYNLTLLFKLMFSTN